MPATVLGAPPAPRAAGPSAAGPPPSGIAAPGATALARRVRSAPTAPLHAVVVGPGGTGKTTLLDALGRAYADAGVPVVRDLAEQADLPAGAALLVDDAHRLDAPGLDRLRAVAEDPGARLVVAHRPWPRPQLRPSAGVAARRIVVVLGHLSRDAVAARIAGRVGVDPPSALVDVVHEQSGGLPALVDIVTQALRDTGRFDAHRPEAFRRPDLVTVSVTLAERLRHQVDALDEGVRALMEAMAIGASLDSEVLGALLEVPAGELSATVEAARATGLLTDCGALIPFVRGLFLRLTPVLRARELQRRLAGVELDRGGSVLVAGRRLLGTGASGSRTAAVLRAAAEESLGAGADVTVGAADVAAELLADAVRAGTPAREVAGLRARALALAGDLDAALRVGDAPAADPTAPGRVDAVLAIAAVLAHRGLLIRSGELYRSLAPSAAVLAVPGLVATGALDDARAVLAAAAEPGAGLLDGAATLMARGMLATVEGPGPAALSQLARAAVLLEPVAAATLLPDTPAALTAVVALQCGEPALAEEAVRRALTHRHGGRAAHARHRLLLGWVQLSRGHLDLARRALGTAAEAEPRDELVAAALAVALARRAGDAAALAAAWGRARGALVRHPVDLTTLLPLGELAVAVAHLGEEEWLAPHLDEADALLHRLDRPPLWTGPLRWYRLQAALVAGRDEEADAHTEALCTAPPAPYAAVLAAAATCWRGVRAGQVDAEEIVAIGRRMSAVGLGWEGAQLAGRAAPLTGDRRATAGLHAVARALHAVGPASEPDDPLAPSVDDEGTGASDDAPTAAAAPSSPDGERGRFTERELEIGRHILAGLTYKQIGGRLFLSAKTVEHHVARMRQRSGAGTRDELFGLLRMALEGERAG